MELQTKKLNAHITHLFILISLTLLFSCSGHKKPNMKNRFEMEKQRIIEEWDIDGNSIINCIDQSLKRKQQFTQSDLDKNNFLDVKEFRMAPWGSAAFAAEYLSSYDQNNDSLVSLSEFENKPDPFFVRLDKNQDCIISDDEIKKMRPNRRMRKRT